MKGDFPALVLELEGGGERARGGVALGAVTILVDLRHLVAAGRRCEAVFPRGVAIAHVSLRQAVEAD